MNGIERKRRESDVTQEELAELLDVSRSTVSMWEIGKSFPKAPMLLKLSELFGCTINELLKTDEP